MVEKGTISRSIPGGGAIKWESMPGMIFTISYQVVKNKWPIVFHHNGHEIEIEQKDLHDGVKSFVENFGLTQATLWDTYRKCDRDIAFSKIGRDVK